MLWFCTFFESIKEVIPELTIKNYSILNYGWHATKMTQMTASVIDL